MNTIEMAIEMLVPLAEKPQGILGGFYLAGGTAVMFRHWHRLSTDLDFFSYRWFDAGRRLHTLRNYFSIHHVSIFPDNVDFFIDNVRVSLVYFPFRNLCPLRRMWRNIRMADDYDIFLNKLYVAGRRVENKDPYDAAFLYRLYKWDIKQIQKDFEKKFPDHSFALRLGSLVHFENIWPGKEANG